MSLKSINFKINGMSCASCQSSIERALGRKSYIKDITVNLITKEAFLTFDTEKTSVDEIFKFIEKLGFEPYFTDFSTTKPRNKIIEIYKSLDDLLSPKIRVISSFILAGIIMAIAMFNMHNYSPSIVILQLIITLVVMHMGNHIFFNGFKALFHLMPNMNTLVAIGASASFLYSLFQSYLYFRYSICPNLYFESVCVIIAFILFGKFIENRSKNEFSTNLESLLHTAIKTAIKIENNKEIEIKISEIKIGDTLKVMPHSFVPTDGVVLDFAPLLDESMLNGESIPINKKLGDKVFCMTKNLDTAFIMRATKLSKDTIISKIFDLIKEAQASKAKITTLADKISSVFVPSIIVLACLSGAFWYYYGYGLDFSLQIFSSVLLISCPCALGLATPMAFLISSSNAASKNIFFKNISALEKLQNIKSIVFDKTGTLSKAKMHIEKIQSFSQLKAEEILQIAYSIERYSEHIIANAIISKAKRENLVPLEAKESKSLAGVGISANIDSINYLVAKVDAFSPSSKINEFIEENNGIIVGIGLRENLKLLGAILLTDEIKEEAKEVIEELKNSNITPYILSGDNEKNVASTAKMLGVENHISQAMPEEKLKIVNELKAKGAVIMVGDGINDAAALTSADVSIAMGSGNDIAIENSDIVIFNNNLKSILEALYIGRMTIKNIKINLGFAFAYNVLLIPVAMGALIPLNIVLNPMLSAIAMSCSSLCVVANSMRLRKITYKGKI